MSLNIMSGTTKRSRFTVFAAALFHWCLYYHQRVLFFRPCTTQAHSHLFSEAVLHTLCWHQRCTKEGVQIVYCLVYICLGFMIGQVSCISWQYSHRGICLPISGKYHVACVHKGHVGTSSQPYSSVKLLSNCISRLVTASHSLGVWTPPILTTSIGILTPAILLLLWWPWQEKTGRTLQQTRYILCCKTVC